MLTTETKRHIDTARQILVGVVPNPTSQIDQITNALIYKFMDDMDQSAIRAGGKPSFFIGDLERYAWTRLMDSRVGNQERMNLYSEALIKFSESKQLPTLFRDIFKQAFLPYRSPEVLGLFLKEIDFFNYSHPEELGNAYEYLLSIMSSQGDAGQFRTPRHIIDFIVSVVNPTKDDKILDPACGTAGFLISAYKYILSQHDGKNPDGTKNDEKPLTPDDKRNLMNNFEGYDIDPGMVRIAQVNMYLHQFKNPRIIQYDSLSQEERWNDKFNIILANPPFMSPKGGVRPHNKFSIPSNRSEVLFVDYIMEHLLPKGRAGIIVPEGIIFQSGIAYKQLRKKLVEDGLYAVVSLPSGVFQPYSGVKTSILLFDNEISKETNNVLFVKIENDGFDLGAQRKQIEKNDLPQTLQTIIEYKKFILTGNTQKNIFFERIKEAEKIGETMNLTHYKFSIVSKKLIEENGDYNLSGDRYKIEKILTDQQWPLIELGDICEIQNGLWTGKKPPHTKIKVLRNTNFVKKTGLLSFDDIAEIDVEKKQFETRELKRGDILLENSGGSINQPVGRVAYFNKDDRGFSFSNFTSRLRVRDNNAISSRYLWYILSDFYKRDGTKNMQSQTSGIKNLDKKLYLKIKIPIPPFEMQKKLVDELDVYQKIIDCAKDIVTNWKPRTKIDENWEWVKLGDICNIFGGGTPSRNIKNYWGGSIPWISSRYFSDEHTITGSEMISEEGLKNSSSKIAPQGSTILITRVSVGKFAIADKDYAINQDLTALVPKNNKLDKKYLWYISEIVADRIKKSAVGIGVTGVTRDFVVKQKIPLPPIENQKLIVEKIEEERTLVNANKKLIEIYQQKIKDQIAEVWGN